MSRHGLAGPCTRRAGARADRSDPAMRRVSVRRRTPAPMPALHTAGEPFTDRRTLHIHEIPGFEHIRLHLLANFIIFLRRQTDLPEPTLERKFLFLKIDLGRLAQMFLFGISETQLDRFIAMLLGS